MAQAFGTFAQEMSGKSMPDAASTAAADQVRSDASLASSGFARLAAVTSPAQYQQVVASTGLESLLGRFDNDYRALGNTLGAQNPLSLPRRPVRRARGVSFHAR